MFWYNRRSFVLFPAELVLHGDLLILCDCQDPFDEKLLIPRLFRNLCKESQAVSLITLQFLRLNLMLAESCLFGQIVQFLRKYPLQQLCIHTDQSPAPYGTLIGLAAIPQLPFHPNTHITLQQYAKDRKQTSQHRFYPVMVFLRLGLRLVILDRRLGSHRLFRLGGRRLGLFRGHILYGRFRLGRLLLGF